jgi:PAS domain-containing protein/CheY-like chemotaxis protein
MSELFETEPQPWALVADADLQRAQTHRHLLEAEGFSVQVARDGELARKLVTEKGPPRLSLIDLSLARLDGFGLSKLIRFRAPRSTARIVAHSASAALRTTAQQKQGELGLSGIFASWAPVETVKKAVRKAIDEASVAPAAISTPRMIPMLPIAAVAKGAKITAPAGIELGPTELMPADHELEEADDSIQLTPLDELAPETLAEPERLLAIEKLVPKDGRPAPEELQKIVEDVVKRFGVSSSFISIIMKDRQWLRASSGIKGRLLDEPGVLRTESFCTHVVQGNAPLVVPDAAVHPLFSQNPLVKEGLLRSYAGAPLVTPDGAVLGSLCMVDSKPMQISFDQVNELVEMARQVAGELELSRLRKERAINKPSPFVSPGSAAKAGALGTWYDAVLENIGEGIMVLDESRAVVVANRQLARLLDISFDGLIGKTRDQLLLAVAPKFVDPEGYLEQVRAPKSGPYALRAKAVTLTGLVLSWVTRPVLLENGPGHLVVLSDVTGRRQGPVPLPARNSASS